MVAPNPCYERKSEPMDYYEVTTVGDVGDSEYQLEVFEVCCYAMKEFPNSANLPKLMESSPECCHKVQDFPIDRGIRLKREFHGDDFLRSTIRSIWNSEVKNIILKWKTYEAKTLILEGHESI